MARQKRVTTITGMGIGQAPPDMPVQMANVGMLTKEEQPDPNYAEECKLRDEAERALVRLATHNLAHNPYRLTNVSKALEALRGY